MKSHGQSYNGAQKRRKIAQKDDNVTLFFKRVTAGIKRVCKFILHLHRAEKLT